MYKCENGETACVIATEKSLFWGLSVFGGAWFVGTRDALSGIGVCEIRPGLTRDAIVTLAYVQGLKSSHREEYLSRFGLAYRKDAPAIVLLCKAGCLTINKAGAIALTPFGRNYRPYRPTKDEGTDRDGYYMPGINMMGWVSRETATTLAPKEM